MKNNLQNLSDEQRRKILAAAEIVDGGDMAVVKKIIEFNDTIDSATEKVDGIEKKVDETITEAKKEIDSIKESVKSEVATKLSEVKDGKTPTEDELKSIIIPLIPKVKDGKTPTKKELISLIEPLIPTPLDGKDANPEDVVPLVLKAIKPTVLDDRQKIVEKINSGKKNDLKIGFEQIDGVIGNTEFKRAIDILDKRTQFLINKPTGNSTSGSTTFIGLTDVPSTYSGSALKIVRVNAGGTGLEFVTASGGGDMLSATYDPANIAQQVVGLTASQTLTNKTLTSPTINAGTFGTSITASYATVSTVPYFDASKNLISSAVTPTELGYLSGVTSAIQTQINGKQASGTYVTSITVASANGFAGSSSGGSTPAITLTTTITGVLKGNGTAISAATAGSDYAVGSLGLAGGQTIAGSTLTGENLTLRANAADLTTGQINITSTKDASNTTTASVAIAGGLAVAKRIYALDMTVTNTITGSVSGNAGTATALQNARTIGGVSFDGTTNITVASATGGFAVSGGALTIGAGTVGAPSLTFVGDTDNGMYYLGTNNYAFAAGGSKIIDIATTGISVTGSITASGLTAGRVLFSGASGVLSTDSTFLWDNTNKALNVGGGTASFTLGTNNIFNIITTYAGYLASNIQNLDNGTTSSADLVFCNDATTASTNYADIGIGSSTNVDPLYTLLSSGDAYFYNQSQNLALFTATSGKVVKIGIGGSLAANEVARFTSTGLTLGLTGTLTGQLSIKGSTSGTAILTVPAAAGTPTLTLPTTTDTLVGKATTDTLTNKTLISTSNVVEEITTTSSSATPTPTGGSLRNFFYITAQAAAAAFAAPSGTPANGNYLTIRILDNGTARALTWNAIYRDGYTGYATLPTTTILGKTMYIGFRYNSADSKWDLVSVQVMG